MQGNRWNRVVNEIVLHTTGRNGKRKLQRQGSEGRADCETRSKPETNCVPVAERARRGVPSKSRYHWRGQRTKFRNKVDSRRDPCSKNRAFEAKGCVGFYQCVKCIWVHVCWLWLSVSGGQKCRSNLVLSTAVVACFDLAFCDHVGRVCAETETPVNVAGCPDWSVVRCGFRRSW